MSTACIYCFPDLPHSISLLPSTSTGLRFRHNGIQNMTAYAHALIFFQLFLYLCRDYFATDLYAIYPEPSFTAWFSPENAPLAFSSWHQSTPTRTACSPSHTHYAYLGGYDKRVDSSQKSSRGGQGKEHLTHRETYGFPVPSTYANINRGFHQLHTTASMWLQNFVCVLLEILYVHLYMCSKNNQYVVYIWIHCWLFVLYLDQIKYSCWTSTYRNWRCSGDCCWPLVHPQTPAVCQAPPPVGKLWTQKLYTPSESTLHWSWRSDCLPSSLSHNRPPSQNSSAPSIPHLLTHWREWPRPLIKQIHHQRSHTHPPTIRSLPQ